MNEESGKTKPRRKDPRVWGAAGAGLLAGFLTGLLIFGSPWHLPPAWGDIPTWITAAATIGLLVGAAVTAVYAIRTFRAQAEEIGHQAKLLKLQSEQLELQQLQFKEQALEKRREQASRVFIWREPRRSPLTAAQRASMGAALRESTAVHVKNTSRQPIYDLAISWHRGTAPWGEPDFVDVLMPDAQADIPRAYPQDLPPAIDLNLFGAVARFRDAMGVHWLLHPDGRLKEDAPGS